MSFLSSVWCLVEVDKPYFSRCYLSKSAELTTIE